jgi:hypothetical protein
MKKKRFAEEQVMGILQQAERGKQTIGEICRAHWGVGAVLLSLASEFWRAKDGAGEACYLPSINYSQIGGRALISV